MDPDRLAHAVGASPGRGPCTDAERRAALLVHDALRGGGHEVWQEPEWIRPQWPQALLLGAVLALAGSLLSVSRPVLGAALAGAGTIGLAIEALGVAGPLRWPFPRRATQTVVVEPRDRDAVALLICARTDVPRRALATRLRVRWRAWAAVAAALITAGAAARVADADGFALGIAQFVPTIVLLLAAALAVDAALAATGDGGAEARALAQAVEVHAELIRDPPGELSPGLVLHGAADDDATALRRLLRRDRRRAADTVLLELVPGDDGTFATTHPQLRRAAEEAGGAARRGRPRRVRALPRIEVAGADLAIATADHLDAELASRTSA